MVWNRERTAAEFRPSAGGFLSWTFRGFETYVLVVALGPVLESLLSPVVASSLPFYAGVALGATLLGWGIGGVVRGLTVRIVGRRNTATYSVLGYALLTGLTALSGSFLGFVGLRFLTGVMLGTEGERGTAFLSRFHPDDRRARGVGSVHTGFGVGVLLASAAWFALQSFDPRFLSSYLGTESWRYLFVVGVLPALFVLSLRRTAAPSERELREAQADSGDRESGDASAADSEPTTLAGLFGSGLRRRVAVGTALAFAALAGWWGVTAWIPLFASDVATGAGLSNPDRWGAIAGVCYGIGAIAGYATVEPIADRIGRVGSLLFVLVGSFAAVQVLYLLVRSPYLLLVVVGVVGYFTLGQLGWLYVYLPELFPSAARESGLGTAYTLARLLAFAFPILVGFEIVVFDATTSVIASFGVCYGVGILAALFVPDDPEQPATDGRSS